MLSVGVEAALEALMRAAKRDGYELNAHVLLTSVKSGRQVCVTNKWEEWYEVEEVPDVQRR